MKKNLIFSLSFFVLTACSQTGQTPSDDETSGLLDATSSPESTASVTPEATDEAMHIGCQEGEVDQSGTCVPADPGENNRGLFEQDLDSFVRSEEIIGKASGFLAEPEASGSYPGVVMIHEWWGLNDNIRQMAKLLAKEGYTVFAIDLYDGEVAEDSAKAGELASAVRNDPEAAVARMQKAVQYLREQKNVPKIASLGWCFGGQQSLQLALNDSLDATVIYYGQLTDDKTQLDNITWPVLGIFGETDQSITVESVRKFDAALDELNITNEIFIYPGVGHAFANPSGSNYAADETRDAWKKTVEFLAANLK